MPEFFSRASPILSIQDLSCSYVSRSFGLLGKREIKPVLSHINMDIAFGGIFGLTGESGCGKSTLARCILGLIDYEGEIVIDGQKREERGPLSHRLQLARKVQMVFQDSGASLNPAKRIGWLMEEALRIHRIGSPPERERKTDDMLVRVGLDPSYKKRRVNELSSGQKQRVCVGRALLLEPKLLIADEAISSLDVSVGAQILNLFRELHNDLGLSILFISHNTDAAEYLCDSIAVMEDGRIAAYGAPTGPA
ncbi:MAG: ATP-binding cassette domain-containing protein [Treponema sp.]|jgi:ABC-type dipeptide/oligopeptide/nickel transport system ATPase subunit|nr:ATP-binding cassette domain-containing protein [Treponema sp.]